MDIRTDSIYELKKAKIRIAKSHNLCIEGSFNAVIALAIVYIHCLKGDFNQSHSYWFETFLCQNRRHKQHNIKVRKRRITSLMIFAQLTRSINCY